MSWRLEGAGLGEGGAPRSATLDAPSHAPLHRSRRRALIRAALVLRVPDLHQAVLAPKLEPFHDARLTNARPLVAPERLETDDLRGFPPALDHRLALDAKAKVRWRRVALVDAPHPVDVAVDLRALDRPPEAVLFPVSVDGRLDGLLGRVTQSEPALGP